MFREYYFFFYNGKCDSGSSLSIISNMEFCSDGSKNLLKFDSDSSLNNNCSNDCENSGNEFTKKVNIITVMLNLIFRLLIFDFLVLWNFYSK